MRYIYILLIIISCSSLSAQTAREIKADIKHVTVFPDRAQVMHEGQLQLTSGTSVLKLTGLSPYIDPQSVQVKGFGSFTVLSVNHQNNYLENPGGGESAGNITKQIEDIQIKIEDERAAISVLKEKSEFITANRSLLLKENNLTPDQIKTIMDLFSTSTEQVVMSSLKRERMIREYEKQLIALQQQLSSRTAANDLPSGEIYVTVMADKPVSGRLNYSYVVSNAGWYPTYDIRVDDIKNPVNIVYKANVYQNTGQDWKDVKLSFSNASPWVSGDVPALYPWFLNFYTMPQPVLRSRSASKGIASESMAPSAPQSEELSVAEMDEAMTPGVQKQTGETTITYDIELPYTIASDNKRQSIEIQKISSRADYKYVAVPKKVQLAYLTANIPEWSDLSLQSGEATLYFENSFVGKSFINAGQVADTMVISLGVDNGILVKREKRKDFTGRRVLGTNRTDINSFTLSVRNNKNVPVLITIRDQVPVASSSDIEIDVQELSGGKFNRQSGLVEWDLKINPAETKELVMTYAVKYPKDRTLILE